LLYGVGSIHTKVKKKDVEGAGAEKNGRRKRPNGKEEKALPLF